MASYGKQMWPVQADSCQKFLAFWNFIWTLVRILLVTDLGISGLICNLQGCSGCFGTRCICKSLVDCTEKYIFSGFYWGYRTFPSSYTTRPKSPSRIYHLKAQLSLRASINVLTKFRDLRTKYYTYLSTSHHFHGHWCPRYCG